MAKRNDWHIWKANSSFFMLPTVAKPHDHIKPTTPAEVRATIYSEPPEVVEAVMNILSGKTPVEKPEEKESDGIPD